MVTQVMTHNQPMVRRTKPCHTVIYLVKSQFKELSHGDKSERL